MKLWNGPLEQEEEYQRWLEEIEQERWESDSFARMRESAFRDSLQLRWFMEFSDSVLRKDLAGDLPINPWTIWNDIKTSTKRLRRLNDAPLSRWLRRRNNFAEFVAQTRRLSPKTLPLERRIRSTQSLLKSWVDEIACFTLSKHTTWQGVVFYYSIESALAAVVYLLREEKITSHAAVLNRFRDMILIKPRKALFPPIDFTCKPIQDKWICDLDSPTKFHHRGVSSYH